MDYSSSIHDGENPAGASPWGSSPVASPQASQTTFGAIDGQGPGTSPAFGAPGNSFEADQDDEECGRPRTASTTSDDDTRTGETEDEDSGIQGKQHPGAYNDENVSPSQARDANRFSGDTARASQEQAQVRRSTQPQYKLQAKITGLERAAKKDPILRFDVHVSVDLFCSDVPLLRFGSIRLTVTDQPAKIPNNPISRRAPSTLRIRQAGRTSNLRKSRGDGPRRPTTTDIRRRGN